MLMPRGDLGIGTDGAANCSDNQNMYGAMRLAPPLPLRRCRPEWRRWRLCASRAGCAGSAAVLFGDRIGHRARLQGRSGDLSTSTAAAVQ
jgi:hypothetical protein